MAEVIDPFSVMKVREAVAGAVRVVGREESLAQAPSENDVLGLPVDVVVLHRGEVVGGVARDKTHPIEHSRRPARFMVEQEFEDGEDFAVGAFFLLLAVVDILWTTLWVEGGAGPLTSRLMSSTWKTLKTVSGERPRVLSLSGSLILILGLTMWIALLWAGWTFLFAGGEGSLTDTRDTGPISLTERFYFVGYTVFTMGNGDFTPNDGIWQVATSLTTASGMLFVTLSVTYVLNVLSSVTQERSLANSINGLGAQSSEILETSWDGDSFQGLEVPLNMIANQLDTLTANHKAYPILHYFFTP